MCRTFASSAPSSTTIPIAHEFGVSVEVANLITSMFLVGYVTGPLIWGPGSELVGRQPILLGTMGAYTLFHLGQALAPNIASIIVTRFFAGFFACAPLVNSGGLIADIWDPAGRGLATSLFTASVFLGPVLGPIGSAL
jgi:DHA1 family multidrug resistance protein-like MFS transporter